MTILATVCCLVSLVLASCGGGGKGGNSPSEMVLKFYDYAKADDGDMARAMTYVMDNTDFGGMSAEQAAKTREQMNALTTGLSEKMKAEVEKQGGLKSFEITEETISGDGLTATVKGYSVYNNDEKGDDSTIDFVKVDNKWMFKNEK